MTQPLTPENVRNYHNELWHTPKGRFLRDFIFGANDGIITTVAFLIATTYAITDVGTLLWVTLIEIVAGALSMAAGAFMAKRSESLFFRNELHREKYEIENSPTQEIIEVKDFFENYGFTPEERDMATRRITANKDKWLQFMMKEEFGLHQHTFDPAWISGLLMGISFIIGSLPLLIPVILWGKTPESVAALGAALLFLVGWSRSPFTNQKPLWAGVENLALGVAIMGLSELLGRWAHHLMG